MSMNQKQRDYFVDRVKDLTGDKIKSLKAMHAADIQKISDEKYAEFVSALGLTDDMSALNKAHLEVNSKTYRIKSILEGLEDLLPDYPASSYDKPSLYISSGSDAHSVFEKYLRACCKEQATKEFYKTDNGITLANLESSQRKAIDTIMMDGSKVSDLTLKINEILKPNGIQLLSNGGI